MLKTGEAAPDFELPDQNDNIRTLDEFSDNILVMFFYIKDKTPG